MNVAGARITLTHQRCFNHHQREAAARCPSCSRFFCRECISEHDDRVLCAACLRKLQSKRFIDSRKLAGALLVGKAMLAVMVAWFFFYLLGEVLLQIPSKFHEGTIWTGN